MHTLYGYGLHVRSKSTCSVPNHDGFCVDLYYRFIPEFIKAGNYTRIGSIAIAIGGIIGVTVAYSTLVKSMPIEVL